MMKIWWWQCHDNSHNSQGHLSQCETPTLHPANWCLFFFFRGRAVKLMYCCPGSSKEAKTLLGHPSVPAFWYLDSFPDSFTSRAQSSLIRWYLQAVVTSLKVLWPASLFNIAQKKNGPFQKFWVQVSSHPLLGNSGRWTSAKQSCRKTVEWEDNFGVALLTRSVLTWPFSNVYS